MVNITEVESLLREWLETLPDKEKYWDDTYPVRKVATWYLLNARNEYDSFVLWLKKREAAA